MKHAGGRPLAFKSVKELQEKIDEYFAFCDNRAKKIYSEKMGGEVMIADPAPYGVCGLASFLGVDRVTLLNYSAKDEYFSTIKKAKAKIEADVEQRLNEKGGVGQIFNLKNNFGWKDKQEIEVDSRSVYTVEKSVIEDLESKLRKYK